jgi:gonadotropin-releasing hormone receptor
VFVLFHLKKSRYKSKMNFLIRHLGLADLSVIFITILTEIIWRITVKWETNEFGCKAVQFGRIFPLYLTSMMVICITLDRFYAFVFPLSILKSKERNKCFLITSYVISFTASIPNVSILISLLY